MSFDVWVENRTPFMADTHVHIDAAGQEVVLLIVSASFEAQQTDNSLLLPSQNQVPVALADVPFGDPALSSTRYEADIAVSKPAVEVIVNGTAYAPGGKPTREMQVGLRVGSIRKVLNVVGDRLYDSGGYGAAHPFLQMPIVYERAFGGTTPDGHMDTRNPVGIGYRHALSADPSAKSQAPNITYPDEPFRSPNDRPKPAGFGTLGRGWQPRLSYAGTFDQAWIDTQWPLPPTDYDPRHNLCTPADQHLPMLRGGEEVSLLGLTPSGRWNFRLPRIVVPVRLLYENHIEDVTLHTDTVIIEPDLSRVTLKSRFSVATIRNAPALREAILGHVTPAFLSARQKGKAYFDPRGGDGTLLNRPVWQQ